MSFQESTSLESSAAEAPTAPVQRKPKFKFGACKTDAEKAIKAFLCGAADGKFGKYRIVGDRLEFQTVVTEEARLSESRLQGCIDAVKAKRIALISPPLASLESTLEKEPRWTQLVKYKVLRVNTVCIRLNRPDEISYIGNSSVLDLIGRRVVFGRERDNRTETDVQRYLAQFVTMIPLVVFDEAGLPVGEMHVIDRGESETVVRLEERYNKTKRKTETVPVNVHFTGASLFEISGRFFLFDIDRREVSHKIFNPFLAELPHAVSSIGEAYESLKPDEVKAAENVGLEVKRQGEWFFIPVEHEGEPDSVRRMELRAGPNRPNWASQGIAALHFVRGTIEHAGREHAPLTLRQWYKAVPNTATRSFTITGDVD